MKVRAVFMVFRASCITHTHTGLLLLLA